MSWTMGNGGHFKYFRGGSLNDVAFTINQWSLKKVVNDDKEGLTLRVRRKCDGFGSNNG